MPLEGIESELVSRSELVSQSELESELVYTCIAVFFTLPELIFLYAIIKLERYPDKFEAREKGVYNKMLDEFVSSHPDESDDPLLKASRLTQEDWCIMEWKEEHQAYCLTAGLIFTVLILRRHFPNLLE